MKLIDYSKEIIKFLKDYLIKSHSKGYVLGLSGGIDSALVLSLLLKAIKKENIHVVILPIESNKIDQELAIKQCKKFKIAYDLIDLTKSYKTLSKNISIVHSLNELSKSNIKVRLRMLTLYAIAQSENSLVVGTDNLDERYVGYFTKYGDGAADLLPIAKLTKSEVRKLAKQFGVIDEIISRPPTAGLFNGQTDEKDLKVSYETLDKFLLGEKINIDDKKRIKYLHKISNHKRIKIPEPNKFNR